MAKILIDTNLIIRFLVNDEPQKVDRIEKFLSNKDKKVLQDTIVAEIVWVLSSFYKLPKLSIIEKIRALINTENIECNNSLLEEVFSLWEEYNISFIDAFLAAIAKQQNIRIYSYDEKFDKIKGVTRKEP